MNNSKCIIFGHKYRQVPNNITSTPCDKWDDCDITDHRVIFLHWFCKRCNNEKVERTGLI